MLNKIIFTVIFLLIAPVQVNGFWPWSTDQYDVKWVLADEQEAIQVEKGDIILLGSKSKSPTQAGHRVQSYLAYMQAAAFNADPSPYQLWIDLGLGTTWDGSKAPLGHEYYWGHIELICEDKDYAVPSGFDVLVMKTELEGLVDTVTNEYEAILSDYGKYEQPTLLIPIQMMDTTSQNGGWTKDIQDEWESRFGIDISQFDADEVYMGGGPYRGQPDIFSNIEDPRHSKRNISCSSALMWATMYALHEHYPELELKNLFYHNPQNVNAVDCVSPAIAGQVMKKYLAYGSLNIYAQKQ